jgi:hypothetical protein
MKFLENHRFLAKEIDPSKFTKIINKAHIVIVFANRSRSWPDTFEKTSSKGLKGTLVDLGYGS